ncbi:uncharacterized protein MEPE_06145 [Melanopsichium pennsylvanicum]|uniref:Uncharacterized protein n=1 Tax=Melanopsichium pennsylvanicum TaxID=63383 RepID=A0AAJ5C7Y8_9BASI|nr:uncharacterized protein MEPE_06145 [Melanopsichium pennsylvanicum]
MALNTHVDLLPPPMKLYLDTSATLPSCSANLMPFSIDYDGPAPIDSFLIQAPAPSQSSIFSPTSAETDSSSLISAFRGRAIQSTPLQLPTGFVAKVITVSQVAPARLPTFSKGAANNHVEEVRHKKRQRMMANKPPARQQKFSMDSDDDDDDDDDGEAYDQSTVDAASDDKDDGIAVSPAHPVDAPTKFQEQATQEAEDRNPYIRIAPIAQVIGGTLTVWGPDGPIDKGDDTFFRTLGEWYSVISPLLHE